MKTHLLTLLIAFSFIGSVLGQESKSDTIVFNTVDTPAQPIVGINIWYQEVMKGIRYPAEARRRRLEGTVFISFIVNTDSTLSDYTIMKGPGRELEVEAILTIQQASAIYKWQPGIKDGIPVRQKMTFPIKFRLAR